MNARADYACMILAAGLGNRLQPLTKFLPKPLVPVANRPILDHILRGVADIGIQDVYVNLHYRPNDIIRYLKGTSFANLHITWRIEKELTGPAGALLAFEDLLRVYKAVLVISGDALHDIDLASFIKQHNDSSCQLSVAMKEISNPGRYGVAEVNEQRHIVKFVEKPPLPVDARGLVSCGIYCLNPVLLTRFLRNCVYDFGAHLIPAMVQAQERVFCFKTSSYWCDIGDLQTLRQANLDAISGQVNLTLPGQEIRKGVWIAHEAEVAESADLHGPVLVGAGVRISKRAMIIGPAVIGPNSSIGERACLVRSVLLPGAHLPNSMLLADGMLGHPQSYLY